MKLWLDDIRLPPDGWTWAKTYEEAIAWLSTFQIEEVSLDHDLGDVKLAGEKELTGYDVLLYIVDMKMNGVTTIPKVYVHSANPVGVERMKGVINRYLT